MNWAALAALWPFLLGLSVVWSVVTYVLVTRFDPPVEPIEFSAMCDCGHPFSDHASDPHGAGTRCAGLTDSWECTVPCGCRGFEPLERETILDPPRSVFAGFDVEVFLDAEVDRLAIVPVCRHAAYCTTEPGTGQPLKCVDCGQELSE